MRTHEPSGKWITGHMWSSIFFAAEHLFACIAEVSVLYTMGRARLIESNIFDAARPLILLITFDGSASLVRL
jgi:hypothetical protein